MPDRHRNTILVNQRPHHVEKETLTAAEIRDLAKAPANYEVWKVIKDPDPEGQLPVDDQLITDSVAIKSGDRFRVVPPGTFGTAASVITDPIREAATMLEEDGYTVSLHEEKDLALLVIENYALPPGWSKPSTRLLLKLPASFPLGQPDMFWVDEDLKLEGGTVAKQAEQVETLLGQPWRRFSWHPASWNPGVDDIRTFLQFVERRLQQRQ